MGLNSFKQIKKALISVYYKDNLSLIVELLSKQGVSIFSTGGTLNFIKELGVDAKSVEDLTGYPSILSGRVKTLHPKVFGGILARTDNPNDLAQLTQFDIPQFDLVIVDLYPFEETVKKGGDHNEIIEKIDIGGISLIRAAAKNYNDVLIVSSRNQYPQLINLLAKGNGQTDLETRKAFALEAFNVSSHYDMAIYSYFAGSTPPSTFKLSCTNMKPLRYGENPHQKGFFYGNFENHFEQLNGKEVSYNNLLDIDAAINLIAEFEQPTIAILKHNNACGLATNDSLIEAWRLALAGDPVSAFGGVIVSNCPVNEETAKEMDKLFFEVLISPNYISSALTILCAKKNRIILKFKDPIVSKLQYRSILGGVLVQESDNKSEVPADIKVATTKNPSEQEIADLLFANRIVKHSKSNAIVLAKNAQLLASGVGETSRVDALKHAIEKAKALGHSLEGAVMASDAFFPFPDCVEIAHAAGVSAVIQPGGSVRDNESIDFCNTHGLSMVITGIRHFKH